MSLILVKPLDGKRVLNPSQNPPVPLPPEGTVVERSIYWDRRVSDGDVEVIPTDDSVGNKPQASDERRANLTLTRTNKPEKSEK
ncbi:MAG: DUF2635 domain-containing protein [Deltaproteobacteria bacterium]|jgi:hypothetical protein|nr:DUF2635 domain-containing protein [Deltaproteobacteria bacterium]